MLRSSGRQRRLQPKRCRIERGVPLLLRQVLLAGRVLERQEIMRGVWGENFFGDDNLLDVYIRYLRQKIEINSNLTLIHTIRGVGFILRAQEAN